MFLPLALGVLGLVFGYLGQQLIVWSTAGLAAQLVLWPALATPFGLIVWLPLVHWREEVSRPSRLKDAMVWGAYLSMAVLSILLVLVLARNIAWYAGVPRETLYSPRAATWLLATAALLVALGMVFARRTPAVKEVRVEIANLPPRLVGFRIAQITDLHIGATIKRPFVERVVEVVNDLGADIVVLTGDIFDGEASELTADYAPLAGLKAKAGRYYVTGNHEYYWGVAQWIEVARKLGLTPLANSHEVITHADSRLAIAGVNDFWAARYDEALAADPARAIAGAPDDAFKILLAHQPQTALKAAACGYRLQLSGHTHGGQFIPWSLVIRLFHRFARGLYLHEGMWIYVSRGTGYWGPPVRLGSPSEITLITLG